MRRGSRLGLDANENVQAISPNSRSQVMHVSRREQAGGYITRPSAAQLIRLLREHHHQPQRIRDSKFLALRFQALSGFGLAIGLGIAPWLGR